MRDFTLGVANAWGSDNLAGAGRVNNGSFAYHLGQVIGDGGAAIQGTFEVAAGGVGEVGGTGLILTGVGAPAGIAVDIGSTAMIVHGGATGLTGAAHLGKALVTAFSGGSNNSKGSQGGETAGEKFKDSDRAKDAGENCSYCGKETIEEAGPTEFQGNRPHSSTLSER